MDIGVQGQLMQYITAFVFEFKHKEHASDEEGTFESNPKRLVGPETRNVPSFSVFVRHRTVLCSASAAAGFQRPSGRIMALHGQKDSENALSWQRRPRRKNTTQTQNVQLISLIIRGVC